MVGTKAPCNGQVKLGYSLPVLLRHTESAFSGRRPTQALDDGSLKVHKIQTFDRIIFTPKNDSLILENQALALHDLFRVCGAIFMLVLYA